MKQYGKVIPTENNYFNSYYLNVMVSNKAGVYKLTSDTLNAVASFPTFFFPEGVQTKRVPRYSEHLLKVPGGNKSC